MIPIGVLASSYVATAGGGGGGVTFLQTAYSSYGPASSWTFSDQALGAASADRVIVVAIAMRSLATPHALAGVTIGGVTATIDIDNGDDVNTAIAHAAVPTGTTGDVVVTAGNAGNNCAIALYSITGYTVTTADTAEANGTSVTATPTNPGLIVATSHNSSSGSTCAWSGIDEDYDEVGSLASFRFSGGRIETASTSDVTITSTWSTRLYSRISAVAFSLS